MGGKAASNQVVLEYIGDGFFVPGVPQRDLTNAQAALYGGVDMLVESGCYRRVESSGATVRKNTETLDGEERES